MVIKVRFPSGSRVTRRQPNNAHIAAMVGVVFAMLAVALLLLSIWRLTADLDWTDPFFIPAGLLSHWQVWFALALMTGGCALRFWRYAHSAHFTPEADELSDEPTQFVRKAAGR